MMIKDRKAVTITIETTQHKFTDYSKVPDELRSLPRWGYAKLEKRNGRLTKVPYSANGERARSDDESTWSGFDTALDALKGCQDPRVLGLAFFLKPPYMLIDLDHLDKHNDNRETDFDQVAGDGYKEYSQSGTGVHYLIKSDMPLPRKRHDDVEMYTSGRFIALTGNVVADKTPAVLTISAEKLAPVYQKYIPGNATRAASVSVALPPAPKVTLSDDEIISKAENAKNGALFKSLFYGPYSTEQYKSHSEADGALCVLLAFWTQRDPVQIDSIFRKSALMRDKWDEKHGDRTVGQITIESALDKPDVVYQGHPQPSAETLTLMDQLDKLQETSPAANTPWRSYDDRGAADRLNDRYGKIFLFDTQKNVTLFYNGLVWKEDTTRKLEHCYNVMADSIKYEQIHTTIEKDEDAAEKARNKFVTRVRNLTGKRGALSFFRDQIATGTDTFDTDASLLNTPGAVLKLGSEVTYLPHKADQRLSMITVGKPTNKEAAWWQRFLNQIFQGDQDLIDFIQRAVGYSIAGTNYERVMFVLYGEGDHNGSNGKSVFVQTIANVLGDYAVTINPAALAEKKFGDDADKPNPEIARLEHKRFVTTSELPKNMKFNEALIKRLTSGEKVPVRDLYQGTKDFMPTGVIWLTSNYKPLIQGQDSAIWKRLVFVPMTAQINKVVLGLADKLTAAEKDEILQWIIDGYTKYKSEGLNIPDEIIANNVAYKSEMDVVQQFTDDCIDLNSNRLLPNKNITERFNEWAPTVGIKMSGQTFIAMFKGRYSNRIRRVNSFRGFDNMALKTANLANPTSTIK